MTETGAAILVVGAGPTGLMMAAELALHGVKCRIIDKEAAPSDKSKALAIHARTLEVLESLGIADEFVTQGHKLHGMQIFIEGKPAVHARLDRIASRYPYVLALAQNETERILEQHLATRGVQVERQTELTGLSQDGDGVSAMLRRADGAQERFTTPYLIGCDGAHSTVRHVLGLRFEGAAYEELFVLADVQIAWQFADDEARIYVNPEGMAAYFPMGRGRYRLIAELPQNAAISPEPSLAEVQAVVDRFGPSGTILSQPHWLATFRIHRRKVASYRSGRVFVAGDAAHIHSPAGGQGMNTGIQDVHNLAWKLALVLKGAAAPALLDSYQAERHPVAEQVLRTSDAMTRVISLRNPLARAVRDFVIPVAASQSFVQKRFTRDLAELSVNYRRSPIVGQSLPSLRDALRQPGLGARAWWAFNAGPHPGDRAPDVTGLKMGAQSATRLYEALDPTRHNLLLFVGNDPMPGGDTALRDVAEMAAEGFGALIKVLLIAPESGRTQSWPQQLMVTDPDAAAHRAYGASVPCLYLLRPDRYVGFRSLLPGRSALGGYVSRIFRLRAFTS
jgi:2-polyprenyl-6-methoxyphenol hydroxylase-like FAD-dependent oxidoreductase